MTLRRSRRPWARVTLPRTRAARMRGPTLRPIPGRRRPRSSPSVCQKACSSSLPGSHVLGVRTAQLNGPPITSSSAPNQLASWAAHGRFRASPDLEALDSYPRLVSLDDESAPLEDRVRSYWDGNCSMCPACSPVSAPAGTSATRRRSSSSACSSPRHSTADRTAPCISSLLGRPSAPSSTSATPHSSRICACRRWQ